MEIKRPPSKQPIPEYAKCVFNGIIFDVYQWQQKQFDGTTATFEKLKRPDTVMLLPVTNDKKIVITEQEQPGKQPFIGSIGGRVDPGEDILTAAKRELLEESGYEANEFVLWDAQQPITKIDWAIYTFIAKGLRQVAEQDLDSGEKIKLKYVTFDEFVDLVLNGRFADTEVLVKFLRAKLDP